MVIAVTTASANAALPESTLVAHRFDQAAQPLRAVTRARLAQALLDVELWDAARRAFTLANTRPVALRTITVTADRIVEEEGQLDLFWSDALAKVKVPVRQTVQGGLQAAMDRITTRWGSKGLVHGMRIAAAG